MEDACASALKSLADGIPGAVMGVAVTDGYIHLPGGKTDALFATARRYDQLQCHFSIAFPYRNAREPGGLAIHRPKFLELPDPEPDLAELAQALFEGVSAHVKGSAIWDAHLDESR